jgi:hypothetical protein
MCGAPYILHILCQLIDHVIDSTRVLCCAAAGLSGLEDFDADASPAALTARAAQGQLLLQLHTLLACLQPHSSSSSRAVHSGGVQAALAWHVPEGVLEHGHQHDTAEAFEVRSRYR